MTDAAAAVPSDEVPDFDSAGFMVPPWVKYPDLPSESMGWRMGRGESYWMRLHQWWQQQPSEVRRDMQAAYPPPPAWAKVYVALG